MLELKRALDARGHCLLEMPTGTGKTITLLSLITSYQLAHKEVGKLIYCTRTVPEMEKVLAELAELIEYRAKYLGRGPGSNEILALGLSSRKNLCIHPRVAEEGSRESVDAGCRRLTATWVRERAAARGGRGVEAAIEEGGGGGGGGSGVPDIELCEYFEGHERAGVEALLPPGVYTLSDLRDFGRKHGWCPYFLARHMMAFANVVVYNYQYMIDPKVSQMVSRELEKEATVDGASDGEQRSAAESIRRAREADAARLQAEYNRLVAGLVAQGALRGGEDWLANPALPEDVVQETVQVREDELAIQEVSPSQ
ncbi:hypothetical protein PLESTB_000354000 [Pleodorina starrii]|uniref:Helicase ATP-binding domain-containing protein n=1 Tax=Pleodorina starrii TaxID=330485 RepID=A0A9W6EZE5_9CHLO|nr:hypothetical protein PLESTB_000354000 [Pleodorina starrii]